MKIINKIVLIFQPDRCHHCLYDKLQNEVVSTSNGIVCEEKEICLKCRKIVTYWAYGSFDDPFPYMDTKWKRFKYLFFGVV